MILNSGAAGGSGGLKVVASGGASVYGSATVNFPRAAQFLIVDGASKNGGKANGAVLLRPGQNGEAGANVSFAANGQSVSISDAAGWGYDMSYIAFG